MRSPTPPATTSASEATLEGLADSPSSRMTTMAVPAAPRPVQTAQAVPAGRAYMALERK